MEKEEEEKERKKNYKKKKTMPKTVPKKKATKKKTTTKTKKKKGKIKKFQIRRKRRLHTFPSVLKNKKINKQWQQYILRQWLFLTVS